MKRLSRFGTTALMLSLGVAMIFIYQNCGVPGAGMSPQLNASQNEKVTVEDLVRLTESIEVLNEQDKSCSSDDQCGTMAMGSKACGGPQKYLVVSSNNASLDKITAMANELQTREAIYNQENQIVSNCMMLMEPEVQCVASRCEAIQ